jgi:hypothetical protein
MTHIRKAVIVHPNTGKAEEQQLRMRLRLIQPVIRTPAAALHTGKET